MHLYVVRHGETWANAEQRYLGALDPELTERGRHQAQAIGEQLPEGLEALVVSPRSRAIETATLINQRLKLPLEVVECFKERDVGVFEGLTQAEARQRYPELWAQNITRCWDAGPTGGESIGEVVKRVRDGLLELELRYPSKTIVIVAHGFVAKVVRALSKGSFSDIFEWRLPNGSVLALENFAIPIQDADTLRASLPEQ